MTHDGPGVLVSGKGTRFILANTEQLHTKIQQMSDRIRNLEDALQSVHSAHASESEQPHPLMQPELLTIKSTMGLYNGGQVITSEPPVKPNASPSQHTRTHTPLAERGSSEDTVMTTDQLSHTAQVSTLIPFR